MAEPYPYSFSSISLYLQCSQKWYYKYVLHLAPETRPSGALVTGLSAHRALERNFGQKIYSYRDEPVETVVEVFANEMEKTQKTGDVDWGENSSYGKELDAGTRVLRLYQQEHAPKVMPKKVELSLVASVPGLSRKIGGVLDLLDDTYTIVDFKIKGKTPDKRFLNQLQFAFYSYLLHKCARPDADEESVGVLTETDKLRVLSQENINVRLDALIKTKTPKVLSYPMVCTPEDVQRFLFVLKRVDQGIQSKTFIPAYNSPLCSELYCPFWSICHTERA